MSPRAFWMLTLYQHVTFGYFLLINNLPFHFTYLAFFPLCTETVQCDVVWLGYFRFRCLNFWGNSQQSITKINIKNFPHIMSFVVSGFTYKTLIHSELILCMILDKGPISFLHVGIWFSKQDGLKWLSFSHCVFLLFL